MPEPKTVAEEKTPLTREDAVKLFVKQNIVVRVVKTDKRGPVRDPATKRLVTEDRPLAAEYIIGVSERDGEVGITTVDGQKYVQAVK